MHDLREWEKERESFECVQALSKRVGGGEREREREWEGERERESESVCMHDLREWEGGRESVCACMI